MDNMSDLMKMFGDKLGADPNMVSSLFNMLNSSDKDEPSDSSSSESTNSTNTSSFEMPDIETIMKIKKVMDSMKSNHNDPIVNLLLSLKPFIQEPKRSIIDQLIKFIGISNALFIFNE